MQKNMKHNLFLDERGNNDLKDFKVAMHSFAEY